MNPYFLNFPQPTIPGFLLFRNPENHSLPLLAQVAENDSSTQGGIWVTNWSKVSTLLDSARFRHFYAIRLLFVDSGLILVV